MHTYHTLRVDTVAAPAPATYVHPELAEAVARIWAERAAESRGHRLWAHSAMLGDASGYAVRVATDQGAPPAGAPFILNADMVAVSFALPAAEAWRR